MTASLDELDDLWEQLGDIPITNDGYLDDSFLHFEAGTHREEVWRWFEEQNPAFVVGHRMN